MLQTRLSLREIASAGRLLVLTEVSCDLLIPYTVGSGQYRLPQSRPALALLEEPARLGFLIRTRRLPDRLTVDVVLDPEH